MQDLELSEPMDVVNNNHLDFDHLHEMPAPPQDNGQLAAWYDTDL